MPTLGRLVAAVLVLLAAPLVVSAQETTKVARIGYLAIGALGYVEGQNLVIRLKLDLIVTGTTPAARAAQRASATIPIVAYAMGDPVEDGLVASLARPGGNVTGSTFLGPGLVPKRLELLKETFPKLSRVAGLWHPGASARAR